MAYLNPSLSVFAVMIAGLVVGACGDKPRVAIDPEADHCARAAQRINRDMGTVQIIEAKATTNENIRNVRVRFVYPENAKGLINGTILCTYAFPVTVRGDAGRLPQAQSVYFRARHLSENELLLLNMGLRGTKSKLKVPQ